MFPHGHFVRALGEIGDKATENEVLLLEHDVPFHKYGLLLFFSSSFTTISLWYIS